MNNLYSIIRIDGKKFYAYCSDDDVESFFEISDYHCGSCFELMYEKIEESHEDYESFYKKREEMSMIMLASENGEIGKNEIDELFNKEI